MTKNFIFLAPLLVAATIAVGCGGGDGYDDAAPAKPAAAQTPEATAEAEATAVAENALPTEDTEAVTEEPAAEATEVKMAGSTFAPGEIDVKVGDTVTFVNDDAIAHTATAGDGTFDSGTMEPGASFDFTAERPGSISYLCEFHPGMTGTINVS